MPPDLNLDAAVVGIAGRTSLVIQSTESFGAYFFRQGQRRMYLSFDNPKGIRVRVFSIEDGELTGTFYPLSRLRYDAEWDEFVVRDDSASNPESLRELNISLDDIRSLTKSIFPEFDEVRSWTPVSSAKPLMQNHLAFGPIEDVALVVQVSEHFVETMHFQIVYVDETSVIPLIVELFLRIAERWELLFETLNTHQVVTSDEAALTTYVNQLSRGHH